MECRANNYDPREEKWHCFVRFCADTEFLRYDLKLKALTQNFILIHRKIKKQRKRKISTFLAVVKHQNDDDDVILSN